MVKYATKGEKVSKSLTSLFKSVVSHAQEDDNPASKLRSLMLKSVAGNRDIGQSEVCRLLMSEPLYHSSFKYVNQSLDINSKQINNSANENETAFKKTMIDFYENRYNENISTEDLAKIYNLVDFVKMFTIEKDRIRKNSDPNKIVVITKPNVKCVPHDLIIFKEYCYFQLVKYSNWNKDNKNELLDKDNAIINWNSFVATAPQNVRDSIE